MKRRHNAEDIKKFVSHCRNLRNEITFGADIIAGFLQRQMRCFAIPMNF